MITHKSASAPALAVHNNQLYCGHRGPVANSNPRLYWTRFNGSGWGTDTVFNTNATSVAAPAIASYNGNLHVVHRSGGVL